MHFALSAIDCVRLKRRGGEPLAETVSVRPITGAGLAGSSRGKLTLVSEALSLDLLLCRPKAGACS